MLKVQHIILQIEKNMLNMLEFDDSNKLTAHKMLCAHLRLVE